VKRAASDGASYDGACDGACNLKDIWYYQTIDKNKRLPSVIYLFYKLSMFCCITGVVKDLRGRGETPRETVKQRDQGIDQS